MSEKCRNCGCDPIVVVINDCYYAQCSNCTKFERFEFLGKTNSDALRAWDEAQYSRDVHAGRKKQNCKKNCKKT